MIIGPATFFCHGIIYYGKEVPLEVFDDQRLDFPTIVQFSTIRSSKIFFSPEFYRFQIHSFALVVLLNSVQYETWKKGKSEKDWDHLSDKTFQGLMSPELTTGS